MVPIKDMLFGKKAILDAVHNNLKINHIKAIEKNEEILKLNSNIKFEIVKPDYFRQFIDVNHQNIVAILDQPIKRIDLKDLVKKLANKPKATILMVDGIEDARNFGAIIRTAVAFNVDAIIYKNHNQAEINELVIKTSMGAVYYVDFLQMSNLNLALETLKTKGWWIYATCLTDDAISVNDCEFDHHAVIVMGNENKGISPLIIKNSDFKVMIPMNDKIQSLNVSVATGIVLFKNSLK